MKARPGRVKVSVRSYQRSSCIRFSERLGDLILHLLRRGAGPGRDDVIS